MRYYVEINGESSLDIQGLMIQSLPSISKPLIRSKQETIDGRDGDIITKLGYGAYDKTLKIGLWGNYDINEVIAFFNQEGTITFSNEPDKYYRFTILNREDYVSQLDKFRTATIMIHCQPFKYKLNEEAEEIENEYTTNEGTSLTFTNTLVAPLQTQLKGNTSQTGTPTPSSPIPVNVVSGDNEIVVCGKNLFDKNTIIEGKYIDGSGNFVNDSNNFIGDIIGIDNTKTYYLNAGTTNAKRVAYYDSSQTFISRELFTELSKTLTIPNNAKYLRLSCYNQDLDTLQLELSNQTTTYEAYTSTTYNIDLPSANEYNKDTTPIFNGYINNDGSITSNANNRILYIPIRENTTYTIEKILGNAPRFRMSLTDVIPANNVSGYNYDANDNATSMTITNTTHKYLCVWYWTSASTTPESDIKNSIVIYKGTTQPETIELNKIGTYQDYFYKENDKWYLHKEIGKVVLDGTTNSFTNRYTTNTNNYYRHVWENASVKNQPGGTIANAYCNKLSPVSIGSTYGCNQGVSINDINHRIIMYINDIREMTIEQANQWLKTNNIIVYYLIDTPTNTEITYTPLINQLESIKNAMSKEGTTNVNQVNNDLGFIINASVLTGTDSITITNEGNTTSKPILNITGSGVVGVYLENIQMFNITLGTNETIIIDTENMEAYYGSQLKNRQVTGDYSNFALQSGTNNLKFTGLITNVEITNYNRWI